MQLTYALGSRRRHGVAIYVCRPQRGLAPCKIRISLVNIETPLSQSSHSWSMSSWLPDRTTEGPYSERGRHHSSSDYSSSSEQHRSCVVLALICYYIAGFPEVDDGEPLVFRDHVRICMYAGDEMHVYGHACRRRCPCPADHDGVHRRASRHLY